MRTEKEILAYIEEQLWYLKTKMKDKGQKPPLLAKITSGEGKDTLEQKYWLYQDLKWFIEGEI